MNNGSIFRQVLLASVASSVLLIGAAHAQTTDELIVTGTREQGHKAGDSATPIEVISGASLEQTGQVDLRDALEQLSPGITRESFNTNADALTDILTLHGLSPNHLLVLIDGKRRHSTANNNTYGPYQGQSGVDLDVIPVSAIDHIEILRDGDSAQYGADAIAGVINIILKSGSSGGSVETSDGAYYAGDGFSRQVSGDAGFSLGEKGFVHLSAEYSGKDYTDRNGLDPRTGQHTNTFEGNPANNTESLGIKSGYWLNDDVELYGFATYAHREGSGKEIYRLPSLLPTVYPNGFVPEDTRLEDDFGVTTGLKGDNLLGWSWDLSSTYGRDALSVGLDNSANPDFFAAFGYTPKDFHIDSLTSSQWTNSLDLTRPFAVPLLAAPLTVSLGAEHRYESYDIGAGDYASYFDGGSQALAGTSPVNAGDHSRNVVAAYIDLATKLTPQWQIEPAGRFEHYSDIGDTETGKISTRYDFTDHFALRGSFGTGFQAPSLAQEYFSTLAVGPDEAQGLLSPLSIAAKILGASPLKPERSTNINFGAVINPLAHLNVTIDAYQVDVHDRIVDSGYASGSVAAAALAAGGIVLPSTATYISTDYLQNAANTRTRGVDIDVTYLSDFGANGTVNWSFAANINNTKLLNVATDSSGNSVLSAQQASWLTDVTPKYKLVFGGRWELRDWAVSLHETVYGPASDEVTIYQGPNTFSTTVFDRFHESTKATTDVAIDYALIRNLTLTLGANNLFNAMPNKLAVPDQYNGWQYDGFVSQLGINGGYYYGGLKYKF
jgi:iron complex outermembrane receptor protein